MSLARKYRVRFGTPRGDRILLYFTTAVALHAGAATAGYVSWLEWQANTPPEAIANTPIEFIYVDADDASSQESARRAQSNAKAQGERQLNLPINAGKATVAPQKAAVGGDANKPIDATTLNIPGEVRPAQHQVTPPASIPTEEPKALEAEPSIAPPPAVPPTAPLVAPSLAESIPSLPSEVAVAPAVTPTALPPQPEPGARPFPLSEPPMVPTPEAVAEAARQRAIAPTPTPPEAAPGTTTQPIAATTGLEGVPNPDRTGEDGPVQVAAQQDALRGAYAAQVNAQIQAQWERIPLDVSRQARVRLELDRQGNLIQVALTHPSGSDAADQAALEAVRNAAPFEAFRDDMTDERLGINVTFNYTISTPQAPPAAPSPTTPSLMEAAPNGAPHPQSE